MADWCDEAAAREEKFRAAAIARHQGRKRPDGESPGACVSCGEEIPQARREAVPGTDVCGFCARELISRGCR
jgi:phage/conjugal plasmid C-4 type zinc finger TraR family protein